MNDLPAVPAQVALLRDLNTNLWDSLNLAG